MSDFSKDMEKLGEATSVMARGVGMFAEALVEAFSVVIPQMVNAVTAVLPSCIKMLELHQLKEKGEAVAPRVTHLAFYAKKKRIRKKNLNRLKKILNSDIAQ